VGRPLCVSAAQKPLLRVLVSVLLLGLGMGGVARAAVYEDEPAGLVTSSSTLAKVRALYEHAHLHEHTRAVTIFEDWRLYQDGTVGSFKVNRLGRDVRETTTLGPLAYARGALRGVHWEQTRNGLTFTYPGVHEQRDAISDHAFRDPTDDRDVRLMGDSTQFGAYVVEINPPACVALRRQAQRPRGAQGMDRAAQALHLDFRRLPPRRRRRRTLARADRRLARQRARADSGQSQL
jgi:hypothetical protein